VITEDGTSRPIKVTDGMFDFVPQETFRRYLNRYKNKWAKVPQKLIEDPWYEELNRFMLWLNQIRDSQGLKLEALVSTSHRRVLRPKAKKQGMYAQYDIKDDDKVAAVLLRNDGGLPVRLILMHGGIGVHFEDVWTADGKLGSSDWRTTWKR